MVSGSLGLTQELRSPACLPGAELGREQRQAWQSELCSACAGDPCLKCSPDVPGVGQSRREVGSEHFCDLLPARDCLAVTISCSL